LEEQLEALQIGEQKNHIAAFERSIIGIGLSEDDLQQR